MIPPALEGSVLVQRLGEIPPALEQRLGVISPVLEGSGLVRRLEVVPPLGDSVLVQPDWALSWVETSVGWVHPPALWSRRC